VCIAGQMDTSRLFSKAHQLLHLSYSRVEGTCIIAYGPPTGIVSSEMGTNKPFQAPPPTLKGDWDSLC
jgi:hypothetical protein